ncbi:alpha/beta fold hydrolase [Kribbella sp. NBC_00359]|uniref:alpha/beta fold hydrolase n=1 Tax=Kribbella sp. NBC_00359 TaxID=2975966 RepID=UPI002E1F3037
MEVVVGRENSGAIRICYEDHGHGDPVVLVHGYLQDGRSWEKQESALLTAGYRVITYDRRGFGASTRPSVGYGFDTLAADLAVLVETLDLQDAVLVGFCSGTGDVTRYLGTYGESRVRAVALLAPLPPYLPRTAGNPDGIDLAILDELAREVIADRPAAAKTFLDRSYNIDLLGGTQVSDQAWQNSFHVALGASAVAARGGVEALLEDFRADLARITVPVLVVQGDRDRIMPPEATGDRLSGLLPRARHVVVPEGPHALIWTHADQVNQALLDFLHTL